MTMLTSIPKEIVRAMRLQTCDFIEFVYITEGLESNCRVRKTPA